jgi:hypothetical protein
MAHSLYTSTHLRRVPSFPGKLESAGRGEYMFQPFLFRKVNGSTK